MKNHLQLKLLTILFLTFSCKENTNEAKKSIEQNKMIELSKDSIVLKKKELSKNYKNKYVTAKSGLNYRDFPNGKVLGKFPLNTSLKLIENVKISDTVNDDGKLIIGNWVGVQNSLNLDKNPDTVYVFDSFLSDNSVQPDIQLYYVSSYYKENNGNISTAFLNLSETYFENIYNKNGSRGKNLILNESNLKKDTIRLNKSQRNRFLKISNISESDRVFIYSTANDEITVLNVRDLPAIACINIYGTHDDYGNQEDDYEFGLDLNKIIYDANWSENLAFVGKESPFKIGKLKPIVWTKIENKQFPINKGLDMNDIKLTTYRFSNKNYDYFLQKPTENISSYHLVIIDKKLKSEILNKYYCDTEGTYLTELNIEGSNNKEFYQSQWTGELIKNKAAVVFGFLGYSFGCPSIIVLDKTEPEIPILCDNRH